MRKVLVPLSGRWDIEDPEDLDRPALEAGFVVARQFEAHIEVFCMEAAPRSSDRGFATWIPGGAVEQVIADIEAENDARRHRARATYESVARRYDATLVSEAGPDSGFSTRFMDHIGEVRPSLAARSRIADLIVTANHGLEASDGLPLMLEVALRQSGRPVLITPPAPPDRVGSHVAVAWNGSSEASRAVAMALPFLRAAEDVFIVSVLETSDQSITPSPDELSEYLLWHGISSRSEQVEGTSETAGTQILSHAQDNGCDLVVSGAYTRDRFQRLVCGGVTQAFLDNAPIPVLMVD